MWGLGRGAAKLKTRQGQVQATKFKDKFKVGLTMERTRHATYQEGYRKKLSEINNTNADFMSYARDKAPWLVSDFFAEKNGNINTFLLAS